MDRNGIGLKLPEIENAHIHDKRSHSPVQQTETLAQDARQSYCFPLTVVSEIIPTSGRLLSREPGRQSHYGPQKKKDMLVIEK